MAITIISQPSALALSGNLGKVELDTGTFSGQVTFQLCIPGSTPNADLEIITSQIYSPDSNHRIVIDLSRIISEQLSFNFQPTDITQPWQQPLLARTFYFTSIENADGAEAVTSDLFTVIRAGIDNLQELADDWLESNFLTWQPTVKRVTYSTPEFLTYYAQDGCTVHVRIYYPDGSDPTDHTLAELTAGAWTIPVSYSVIAALLELTTPQQLAAAEHLPGAYDVWIEDSDSNRLTYIQRYLASAMRENEQWILFENSLGGIDCFRAYGQGSVETEHQHQTAEIDNDTTEYRVDTIRRQKRSTGWLDKAQRRWLLDFFPASRRWICQDGVFRPIILTDDSATYTLDNMPAEFEFTFRYTNNKPYLNLSRLLTLPSVLDIQAPDMQSFTVPPRLVEFPRIGPSEGALIPAQLPHSNTWGALSLSEIAEIVKYVSKGSHDKPIYFDAEGEAREIDALDVPGSVIGRSGVAAHGIADLSEGGGGGGTNVEVVPNVDLADEQTTENLEKVPSAHALAIIKDQLDIDSLAEFRDDKAYKRCEMCKYNGRGYIFIYDKNAGDWSFSYVKKLTIEQLVHPLEILDSAISTICVL